MNDRLKYAMVKTAVTKGLKDMRENFGRGLRYLVDLDAMLARGEHHKRFIAAVQDTVLSPKSPYYDVVQEVVRSTDEGLLTSFSINVGYHSLSYGASVIRKNEQALGCNIPWCIKMNLTRDGSLDLLSLQGIIGQGKALGIYFYLVAIDRGLGDARALTKLAAAHPECSFMAFVHPSAVTEAFMDEVFGARNMVVVLDLAAENVLLSQKIEALRDRRLFYGGFLSLEKQAPRYMDGELYRQWARMRVPFVVWMRRDLADPAALSKVYRDICDMRWSLASPCVPIDLYGDAAFIDRNISSEACFLAIDGDGNVIAVDGEEGTLREGFSVRQDSLQDILVRAMPKKAASAADLATEG